MSMQKRATAKPKGDGGVHAPGHSQYGPFIKLGDWTARVASVASPGGGPQLKVPDGSPYAGKQIGGGTREQIWGTTRYGSGFPYGGSNGTFVSGRPFPFGFAPIVFTPQSYLGNDEYRDDATRPGGIMHHAMVAKASSSKRGISERQSHGTTPYHLIGDFHSVHYMLDALYGACGVATTTPHTFNYSTPTLQPEQIIQYYRASSFALAMTNFNQTENAVANVPKTNDLTWPSLSAGSLNISSLPEGTDLTFLGCINATLAGSLPILDPSDMPAASPTPAPTSSALSHNTLIGGALPTLALLWVGLHFVGLI